MLKLLRNPLEAFKEIILPGTGKARWYDIVRLHKLHEGEGLRAANRLLLHIFPTANNEGKVSSADH